MNSGNLEYVDEAGPFGSEQWQRITDLLRTTPSRRPALRPMAADPGFLRADLPEWERIYWIAIWNMREQVSAAYRHLDDALGASERPIAVRDVRITLAVDDRAARDRFATARDAIDRRARQGMGRGTAPPPRPARQGLLARAIRALDDWRTR